MGLTRTKFYYKDLQNNYVVDTYSGALTEFGKENCKQLTLK
jgi:hypothetical protein